MITLNEPVVIAQSQTIGEPEIHITGKSEDGSRTLLMSYPIYSETGDRIDTWTISFSGEQFNQAYEYYNSDKALINFSLTQLNKTVSLDEMDDNLIN